MQIIERLERNDFEGIPASDVSVELARRVKHGIVPTAKPSCQIVARIQVILVDHGGYTDEQFMAELEA